MLRKEMSQSICEHKLERKDFEQNRHLRKEYKEKLENLRKSSEEAIDERRDSPMQRVKQQIRHMASERSSFLSRRSRLSSNTYLQVEISRPKH